MKVMRSWNVTSLLYVNMKQKQADVRYTLPEGETQVFASKYKLYLPTEEDLLKELKKEYQAMESVQSDMES